jgi:hypothetical protein
VKFHDKTDRVLFFTSIVITVGNGRDTSFWEAIWINGISPKELAPNLYLQARYKFRTVHKELQNFDWIKNIKQINTTELLDELTLLFSTLNEIQLNDDKDTISWKWITSGEYSAASAYDAQFLGAFPLFKASSIWQAKTELKCCFFAWLALLGRALTTDNLMKKNWTCDPCCPLCFREPETNNHILTECNFTEAVWDRVAHSFQVHPELLAFQKGDVAGWISAVARAGPRRQQRVQADIIFFLVVCLERTKQQDL